MAMTASATHRHVSVFALDDGPVWRGASQFDDLPAVQPLPRTGAMIANIAAVAAAHGAVVWLSKGAAPLHRLAARASRIPRTLVIADYDDDDVAIMRSFREQSTLNRLKMNPLRRKHPKRLLRTQRLVAESADAVTFSSKALSQVYMESRGFPTVASSIIPHTRRQLQRSGSATPDGEDLRLAFFGTVRAHKGAEHLVSLMRSDRSISISSFQQAWAPPADCASQWKTSPPGTPLADLYAEVDYLILPMDAESPAAQTQLPAKLIDAAANSTAVAATPTPAVSEYASGAFLPITDWSNAPGVLRSLRDAAHDGYGERLAAVYQERFSPAATGKKLLEVIGEASRDH
jgi:hypothetical protein